MPVPLRIAYLWLSFLNLSPLLHADGVKLSGSQPSWAGNPACLGALDTIYTTFNIQICSGEEYEGYTASGIYSDTFHLANGDDSIRILHLMVNPPKDTFLKRWICNGDTVEGHWLFPGQDDKLFIDTFSSASGCDSVRSLLVSLLRKCDSLLLFSLDSCTAYMSNGSHMDYAEFEAEFTPLYIGSNLCIEEGAGRIFRDMPQHNKHSCTPGIGGSKAMCISVMDTCAYAAGNQTSLVAEIRFKRVSDQGNLTYLQFYAKAPPMYEWIDGGSGPNNYPQRFGFRILSGGEEVFRRVDIPTTPDWTRYSFDFVPGGAIEIGSASIFRIEWFPYCPVGNGAPVSVWDIDEVSMEAGCTFFEQPAPYISGTIHTPEGSPLEGISVFVADNVLFSEQDTVFTNSTGEYKATTSEGQSIYYFQAYWDGDPLEGVSTLDLLRIQRHLLGLQPFNTVFQIIAADIDRNGRINVIDLLELKKLLLGINSLLPNNTSWRIGAVPPGNPGLDVRAWKEVQQVDYHGEFTAPLDWVAVKVGDCDR